MTRHNLSVWSGPLVLAAALALSLLCLSGCKHASTAKAVQPPPAPLAAPRVNPQVPSAVATVAALPPNAEKPRISIRASQENRPSLGPAPPLASLPEGYKKNFGGWAAMVKCGADGCANPPTVRPAHTQIASYGTNRDGTGPVGIGETVHIRSRILIVAGDDGQAADVMEGIILYAGGGESGRLLKGINPKGSAGEFETDFQMEIPNNVPPGPYSVRTTLFVARKPVGTHTLNFDVRQVKRY